MACNKKRVKILDNYRPLLFNFDNPKPLMKGIIEVIRPLIDEAEYVEVSKVIKSYTQRLKYFRCISRGGKRYNLDGQACGEVTKQQMLAAENKISAFMTKKEMKKAVKKRSQRVV